MERSSNLGHSPMITLSMRNAPTGIDLLHSDSNGRMNVFRGKGGNKERSNHAPHSWNTRRATRPHDSGRLRHVGRRSGCASGRRLTT